MSASSSAERSPASWGSGRILPLASVGTSLGALFALSALAGRWAEPVAWGSSGIALVLGALGARERGAPASAALLFAVSVALLLVAIRV